MESPAPDGVVSTFFLTRQGPPVMAALVLSALGSIANGSIPRPGSSLRRPYSCRPVTPASNSSRRRTTTFFFPAAGRWVVRADFPIAFPDPSLARPVSAPPGPGATLSAAPAEPHWLMLCQPQGKPPVPKRWPCSQPVLSVLLRHCSGIAPVLRACCSLGYPLYDPCTTLIYPLYIPSARVGISATLQHLHRAPPCL